jgi:hypothetical protein
MSNPIMKFDNGVDYTLTIVKVPTQPWTDREGKEKFIYEFSYNGVTHGYFAPESVHSKLGGFSVGDTIVMGKHKPEGGQYFQFMVELATGNPSQPAQNPVAQPQQGKPPVDWDLKEAKKEYEIRKAICMKLAVDKIPEGTWTKKTEEEIAGKYTTLMLIMSDDLAIVIAKLRQATGVIHLNAMWQKYSHLWENLLSKEDFAQAIDLCAKIKAHYSEPKKPSLPEPPPPPVNPGYDDSEPLPF